MTIAEKIQKLMDESILFTPDQKGAWLELVPKMNEGELNELYTILVDEVKELKTEGITLIEDPKLEAELIGAQVVPSAPKPPMPPHGASLESLKAAAHAAPRPAPSNTAFAQELKREVETPELRKPTPDELGMKAAPIPPRAPLATKLAPMPKELAVPMAPRHTAAPRTTVSNLALKTLLDIKTIDDLKKVQPDHLRQGELNSQINLLKGKIISLAQANKVLPYYTVSAFQESSLYKTYLAIGAGMIADPNPDRTNAFKQASEKVGKETLTVREFEAIADLRKQIEQL